MTQDDEYEAGYSAFMRRCGYYALAHAELDGMWDKFWEADQDEALETTEYLHGRNDAKARMFREIQIDLGAHGTPRDADRKRHKLLMKLDLVSDGGPQA
jgi:hypothetical protein